MFSKNNNLENNIVSTENLVERAFSPINGKIDILFIYPPLTMSGRDIYHHRPMLPLGIACLAAYLREKGFGVGALDCPGLGIYAEEIFEIIERKQPSVIAFSSTTYTLERCNEIAEFVRRKFPNKLTILGGAHANVAGLETCRDYNYFDIISYGLDGEYIIHDVVKSFSKRNFNRNDFINDIGLLKSIKGIIFKFQNEIIKTDRAESIKDLDELPFPARDLFPIERYKPLANQYRRLPITTMVVIRGCPYVCTFCDQANTGARRRSPTKVIEEIKLCVEKYGVKEITFWDDTLSYHKKWMKEFLTLLIDENLDLIWSCYAAVNTVDKEILQLMSKAGCWNIFYGFETAVEELAENMLTNRKNRNLERMKQVAKWTREAGIEYRGSFMIGMPGETPELAEQTIKNAIEIDPDYAQFSIVCPFPGTQLAAEIKQGKWGKFISQDLEEYNTMKVTWLPFGYKSPEELESMERRAYRKFYLRPSYIVKRILSIRNFEDLKRYINGALALLKGSYLFQFKKKNANV